MGQDFLAKLFSANENFRDNQGFEVVNSNYLDLTRLYAKFLSEKTESNIIILPSNFITPKFSPFELRLKQYADLNSVVQRLVLAGFEKVDQIYTEMQVAQKGDVLTVFTNLNSLAYRIDFFGDEVENLQLIDSISLRPIKALSNIIFLNINPEEKDFEPEIVGNFAKISSTVLIYSKGVLQNTSFNSAVKLEVKTIPLFHKNSGVFRQFVDQYEDFEFFYTGNHWDLIPEGFLSFSLNQNKKTLQKIDLEIELDRGYIFVESKQFLLTDREIFSTLNLNKSKSKLSSKFKKLFDNEVNVNDFVVHEAHGVGMYKGIETKIVLGEVKDYAVIEYLGNDKLLVPLDQLGRLSKYISADGTVPKLTKLGTAEWEIIKRKLRKSVEDIAKDLLEIYAKKSLEKGITFEEDSPEQVAFEQSFSHELTDDQIKTLNEVKQDMESPKPMDRLIIGDVGFGKTEIAVRAAFKAVQSGKQALVLAPTTVLVTQLYEVFVKRLRKFGVKVARVSRFDGSEKNKETILRTNNGKIDIVIGTHRLLSKDVKIKNLGFLIIDEEQRFGVKQKERIRSIRSNIDVLSMSATPIPRTLQMALTGIKDISIIATPPKGRRPVHNEVIFSEEIATKIEEEVRRGGQVFVVHNKVEDLDTFVATIKARVHEEINIISGHGRMSGDKLEKIMFEFQEGLFHVLIATTIIENGLDIPSVNTVIIDNAHQFGLSQLYQLRGRVGRSDKQSYCYLVLPKIKEFVQLHKNPGKRITDFQDLLQNNKIEDQWVTPESVARIEALLENQELGAGFRIASRDLEIRGSGNILGSQQSGHINSVGYEMFIRLLEQEIDQIRKFDKVGASKENQQ